MKEKHNQLFFSLTFIDKKYDTIFVDLTGKFPLRSVDGYTAIFILYDWTSNANIGCTCLCRKSMDTFLTTTTGLTWNWESQTMPLGKFVGGS